MYIENRNNFGISVLKFSMASKIKYWREIFIQLKDEFAFFSSLNEKIDLIGGLIFVRSSWIEMNFTYPYPFFPLFRDISFFTHIFNKYSHILNKFPFRLKKKVFHLKIFVRTTKKANCLMIIFLPEHLKTNDNEEISGKNDEIIRYCSIIITMISLTLKRKEKKRKRYCSIDIIPGVFLFWKKKDIHCWKWLTNSFVFFFELKWNAMVC